MRKIVKVGTMVKVKSGLQDLRDENGRIHMLYIDSSMYVYEGQELKVVESSWNNNHNYNSIKLEGNDWWWNLDCLEEVSEEDMQDLDRVCAECGREIEEGEELIYLDRYDKWVCQDCLDNYYSVCEDCNDYVYTDDMRSVEGGNRYVCDRCFDNYYECYSCGEYHHRDNMMYDENEDEYFCEDCWDDHNRGRIYSYHSFSDWEFFKGNNEVKPPFYIGHELEVENPRGDDECKGYLYDHLNVVLMHDGSLDYGGYEIISHPQSFEYIMEHKEDYKDAFEELINHGYKSHETETCGLHFHVSKPLQEELNKFDTWNMSEDDKKNYKEILEKQDTIIDRIILLMETYKEELISFSRRKPSQLSHWAKFLSDRSSTPSGGIKSLYYIKKHKDRCDRYQALNLTNRNTIEFRIFRGTLKYETFMASIELVNNIVTLCSDLSIPIQDITWSRITQGEFVRAYCEEKGIETDKIIVDNSKEEIDEEKKLEKALKRAYKDIIKIYNKEVKRLSNQMILRASDTLEVLNNNTQKALQNAYCLRDMANCLCNIIQKTKRENVDLQDLKYTIATFFKDYDLSFIDWSQEGYKEIKDKLQLLFN